MPRLGQKEGGIRNALAGKKFNPKGDPSRETSQRMRRRGEKPPRIRAVATGDISKSRWGCR